MTFWLYGLKSNRTSVLLVEKTVGPFLLVLPLQQVFILQKPFQREL
jgi:hypothetical protein